MKGSCTAFLIFLLAAGLLAAEPAPRYGTLKGQILDRGTQHPLPGANIAVLDQPLGDIADAEGRFTVARVPVGLHRLQISMVGYETVVRPDVVLRSNRITVVEVQLEERPIGLETTVVTADYFADSREEVVSTVSFNYEEIRRSPGAAGDISRLLQALPAISMATDQRNDLVVRGGSPAENLVVVDNIEIPNINHFPTQGASGGPIGLLNTDLIADVRFSAGGFSAAHGDRLSSVMEIDLRQGNRDEVDGEANLGMAGAGLIFEGPFARGAGSWLLSGRRSYLDLIVDAIGTGAVPKYSDVQGKFIWDAAPGHRISLLGLGGFDTINIQPEDDDLESDFTDVAIDQYVLGANWRWLWSARGYANTSLAFSRADFAIDVVDGDRGTPVYANASQERELVLRSNFHRRLGADTELAWGLVGRRLFSDYAIAVTADTNRVGAAVPALVVDESVNTHKVGLFASVEQRLLPQVAIRAGLRLDYFALNEEYDLAPRLGLEFDLDERTSLNAAYGIYYQNLPPSLLVQHPGNRSLENPRADHYILGLQRRLSTSVLLTLEGYLKNYSELPVDPEDPTESMIDSYATYGSPSPGLVQGGGEARSYGVELLVQKKLARDVYGTGSYSYSVARYTDGQGVERDRSFDNRHLFSLIIGYRPSDRFEYSLRWRYAGGRPYTPFDEETSADLGTGIIDRDRVNQVRYTPYHRLDVRVDYRKHYENFNLVSFFTLLNAYNRANIFTYYWDEDEERVDRIDQWAFLPVGGFELEF